MRRRFRLTTVERLRTARLETGGRDLVAAQTALAAGQDRRDLLAARLKACSTPQRVTADDLIMLAARRDRLRAELMAAEAEAAALLVAADQARTAWLTARAELRAVESLHEQHREQLRAADRRAEQTEADELATRSPIPRQPGGQR